VPRHRADVDFNDARSDCEVGAFDWRTPHASRTRRNKEQDIKGSIPVKADDTS